MEMNKCRGKIGGTSLERLPVRFMFKKVRFKCLVASDEDFGGTGYPNSCFWEIGW